jgi:hypothetical protein
MPLKEDEIEDILNAVESIIYENNKEKQWHCRELIEILYNIRPYIPEVINLYILNIILEKSDKLTYLGRFVWSYKKSEAKSKPSRIDISQAYISILTEAGKPLSEKELKRRLLKKRGIDTSLQIHPNEKMIPIQPGLWGLVERDISISNKEKKIYLNTLYKILKRRKKALHITEIKKFINKSRIKIPDQVNSYMLYRLAQVDQRFRIARGQLIGLKSWKKLNL